MCCPLGNALLQDMKLDLGLEAGVDVFRQLKDNPGREDRTRQRHRALKPHETKRSLQTCGRLKECRTTGTESHW